MPTGRRRPSDRARTADPRQLILANRRAPAEGLSTGRRLAASSPRAGQEPASGLSRPTLAQLSDLLTTATQNAAQSAFEGGLSARSRRGPRPGSPGSRGAIAFTPLAPSR